jgi:uncharacterized protein
MRLVLDTNVVVSALLWKGRPGKLLNCVTEEQTIFCSSPPLLAELADVLSRPKFHDRISASGTSPAQLLQLYAEIAVIIHPHAVPRIAPDPDDDVVIGTALAAKAHSIVTGDRLLLSVSQYQNVRIITIDEALEAIAAH